MKYGFTIPNLPKRHYDYINEIVKLHGVTQRQVILAALRVLSRVNKSEVDSLLKGIKEEFPSGKSYTPPSL